MHNCYSKDYENPLLFISISPGHLFPLYHGCHCPILDLNAAALLYHSIPSLFRCIVRKMYSRPGRTFSDEIIVWAAAGHSSTVSLDTGENTARCPGHCCVLRGHRLLCPGWTQPWRQSHCASAIVKALAQVQLVATILLLLILLLVAGTTASKNSSKGSQLHIYAEESKKKRFWGFWGKGILMFWGEETMFKYTHAARRLFAVQCKLCTLFLNLNSDNV